MKKSYIFFVLCLIIIHFSCRKDNKSSQNIIDKIPLTENYISYPSNQYDSVGLIHNLCLEQIRILKNQYSGITIHELYDSLEIWMNENFSHNYEAKISYQTFIDSFQSFSQESPGNYFNNSEDLINAWFNRGIINLKLKNYLLSGAEIINFDSTVEFTNQSINALEDEVIDSDSLIESEKKIILSCLSTFRYSYEYWHTNQEDEWSFKMHESEIFKFTGKCKGWCKLCVAGYDVAGIVIGGMLTGYSGNAMILGGAIESVYARCCICGNCNNFNCINYKRKNINYKYIRI